MIPFTQMMRMSTSKRIPQRTCIACRTVTDKRNLVRIVNTGETVEVDPTGRKNGRGAYLCRSPRCWETVLKKGSLGHALRTSLSEQDRQRIREYLENELKGSETNIGTG